MEVFKVKTGRIEENCYVLINNGMCLVVDPGDDYKKIKEVIGDNKVKGVLITHSHYDHIGALRDVINHRNIPIFKKSNLEEKSYEVSGFHFDVIFTPGHCSDLVTFYFKEDNCMFVGDFIFKEDIGRCDLPTGDMKKMLESISTIKKYDNNIILYPGHGEDTTLGYEKENNSYFIKEVE